MGLPNVNSPTFAAPRITLEKFTSLLRAKGSPALPEAQAIWNEFIAAGVDPSFALAQYRVESQMGTAGYAKLTKSWGNMLYDSSLTILAVGKYAPGNDYTYAKYNDYLDASKDYIRYLKNYRDVRGYGTIYEATAEWIGKTPGSSGHVSYVNTIISDMVEYEHPEGTFYEVGDRMIYGGDAFDRATGKVLQKYPIVFDMPLYRGTNGDLLKLYKGKPGNAWWLGPVQGSWEWGLVCIGTELADPDATFCYIKNPSESKVINI